MKTIRAASASGVALLLVSLTPAAAVAASESPGPPDASIASGRRQLTAAEVRGFDVTELPAGRAILRELADDPDSVDVDRRPQRVFIFGERRLVIDAATRLSVWSGLDEAGRHVYELAPLAAPMNMSARAGYAVPPTKAWVYNTDGGFTDIFRAYLCSPAPCGQKDAWKRTVIWTINAAWNYKACSSCTARQYFRIYGHMQAAVITGVSFPYARAWLEFDNNGGWAGSPSDFEFHKPNEGRAGPNDRDLTIGFGTNIEVRLGEAPFVVGGGTSSKYEGTIRGSSEWWHPVVRAEVASGGVQYCRYAGAWGTVRKIATRVGIEQAVNAKLGGWNILFGMANKTDRCPPVS